MKTILSYAIQTQNMNNLRFTEVYLKISKNNILKQLLRFYSITKIMIFKKIVKNKRFYYEHFF